MDFPILGNFFPIEFVCVWELFPVLFVTANLHVCSLNPHPFRAIYFFVDELPFLVIKPFLWLNPPHFTCLGRLKNHSKPNFRRASSRPRRRTPGLWHNSRHMTMPPVGQGVRVARAGPAISPWGEPSQPSQPSHRKGPPCDERRRCRSQSSAPQIWKQTPRRRYTHRGQYGFNMGSIMFNRGLIWFNDGLVGVKKLFGMPLAGQHTVPIVRSNDGLVIVGVMGFTTSGQPVNRSSMDYVP